MENETKNISIIDDERLKELKEFQKNVYIYFENIELLNMAFSHSSYVNEHPEILQNNEKLEFLGDSVLALVVNEYLYQNYPDYSEGQLSKIKSVIVSEFTLASISRELDIGNYILLGKGERQYGGADRDAILADTIEAILGAYYLDSGLKKAQDFILPYVIGALDKIDKDEYKKDYKTTLQLIVQQKYKSCPIYQTIREEGPDHNKIFYVNVIIEDMVYGPGEGNNKKNAQQQAAKIALEQIILEDDYDYDD